MVAVPIALLKHIRFAKVFKDGVRNFAEKFARLGGLHMIRPHAVQPGALGSRRPFQLMEFDP